MPSRRVGLGLTAMLVLSLAACKSEPRTGTVIEREYTPRISGTGIATGTCTGANNSIGTCTGTVFYSEGEKWTLILQDDEGVWAEQVTPEEWASVEIGQEWTDE